MQDPHCKKFIHEFPIDSKIIANCGADNYSMSDDSLFSWGHCLVLCVCAHASSAPIMLQFYSGYRYLAGYIRGLQHDTVTCSAGHRTQHKI